MNLHELAADYVNRYVQRVYDVTPADVQRVARDYIRDEDMFIVIAGDRAAVSSQVASF